MKTLPITLRALAVLAFGVAGTLPATVSAQDTTVKDDESVDDIIVTATRLPRHQKDIAGTVSVITDADIEEQMTTDLADLTRYQPGVTMNTAGRGGNQGFVIRGIGGNRVLTLIDGVRSNDIYSAGPASYGKDAFEVDDLRAVEIIRGPASVLYGADAMGGAVILRTKDPRDYLGSDDSYIGVRTGYSSANSQSKIGVTGAFQTGSVGHFIQYTDRRFEEMDISGDASLNPQDGSSQGLYYKGVWEPSDIHQFKFTAEALEEDIDYVLESDLSTSVTESLGNDTTERYRASLQHVWQAQGALADEVDTQLYWQRTEGLQHTLQMRTSYSFIDPTFPPSFGGTDAERDTDFEFNQDTTGLGVMLTKTLASGSVDHAVVYGVNIDRTDTERPRNRCETELSTGNVTCDISAFPFAAPESFPNKTFPDTETTRTGIYIQDEITFGSSGFVLIPGIRYDRYEMDPTIDGLLDIDAFGFEVVKVEESEVSLNLGAIYDLTENVALFAQYAEGFRPPNFDEANQAFVNYGFGYATVPNPELKPETSQGVEIGLKADMGNTFWSISVYENSYDDFISSTFIGVDSGISLFQDQNVGEARIRGAEAQATWAINDAWELTGAVAYARGDDEVANQPLNSVDPLNGVVAVRYTAPASRWSIESRLTLVDAKDRVVDEDSVTADGYGLLDITGRYAFSDRASLRIGLFNVTDKEYARWTNIQSFDADDLDSIALAQEPGFNFRANLNFNF